MTRYYTDVNPGIAREIRTERLPLPAGFRLIECAVPATRDERGIHPERWLVDDDDAPADLKGALVFPVFSYFGGGARPVIADRQVIEEGA